MKTRRVNCVLSILALLALGAGPVAAQRVSGGGGFPLSPSVTAMWAAIDEVAQPDKKTLSFIIYFRGSPSWHERKWTSTQNFDEDPFVMEFSSDTVTLRLAVDRGTRILSVFGSEIDLAKTNVILVENVDRAGEEVVSELGFVPLVFPADANPAIDVLRQNDAVSTAVVGDTP